MRFTAILFVLLFACSILAEDRRAVGHKAIEFSLNTFDGKRVSLNQLRGRVVLLDFWATWCPPCREELPYLDILQETFGKQGFAVLAVNIDNEIENAREFLKLHDIKLNPLWDEQKKVVAKYDIAEMPTTILIDKNGVIRHIYAGFETEQYIEYKQIIQKLLREPGVSSAGRQSRPTN
jgi:peroxiredoxin